MIKTISRIAKQNIGKRNIKGFTLKELQEFVDTVGEPPFRGKQLFDWLYTKEASSFEEMTSLSKSFRAKLQEIAVIEKLRLVESQTSHADGTTKMLFELSDGKKIESVLIPLRVYDLPTGLRPRRGSQIVEGRRPAEPTDDEAPQKNKRLTLCVSTQVGCPLDCVFCGTAAMGFLRNLSAGEIVDQLSQARRVAQRRITNIVYMGMGEPLMNYENVMKSVEIITTGMGIAARRITVSTAGWADGIKRMADERRKVKLAVSLHTLDERLRTELMPITKKFNLEALIDAVRYYYKRTKRRVTYEYILFDGLNDTDEDIRWLIRLSKIVPCKINIVPFHSIDFTHPKGLAASLRPTPPQRMERFIHQLREAHITVMVRSSAGEDIDAACGQLAILAEASLRDSPARAEVEYA